MYTLTATAPGGNAGQTCRASTTVTIGQPLAPLASSFTQVDVLCHRGATGSIDLTVTGGTTPYTYAWSNGATTQDLSGLVAGVYSVTVTDANGSTCTRSETATITQPPILTAIAAGISVWPSGSGSASVTASGGTPQYTYMWSNGATTSSISGLPAGTYSVSVTDAHGCTATASYVVTQCLGAGGGLTLGFWSNKNGQALITASFISNLNALNLRNASGSDFDMLSNLSANKTALRNWLLNANATNMAYMLSAQLTAMKLNVLNGRVNGASLIYAPGTAVGNFLGFASVNDVMSAANDLLATNGLILDGSVRPRAEALKNALDKGNNNLNFLIPCSSSSGRDGSPIVMNDSPGIESVESITVNTYPNPFVDKINIEFTVEENIHVNLQMYSITGGNVQTLFDGIAEKARPYKVEFTPSIDGMYIYKLVTAKGVTAGKVIRLK